MEMHKEDTIIHLTTTMIKRNGSGSMIQS